MYLLKINRKWFSLQLVGDANERCSPVCLLLHLIYDSCQLLATEFSSIFVCPCVLVV